MKEMDGRKELAIETETVNEIVLESSTEPFRVMWILS